MNDTRALSHSCVPHIMCGSRSWREVGWGVGVRRVNASSLLCCHADVLRKSCAIAPSLTTHPHAVWQIQLYALAFEQIHHTTQVVWVCHGPHHCLCGSQRERGVAEVG